MSYDYRTPPAFTSDMTFERWKLEIGHWQNITKLSVDKQASAILLTLTGNAREAALEVPMDEMKSETGVKTLLDKLATLYAKDELVLSINAWEEFESFQRPPDMKVSEYKIEFERRYNKAKKYDMKVHDGVLAYRFLKSANLSEQQQQLVKATVSEISYAEMTKKLGTLFLETAASADEYLPIKLEPNSTYMVSQPSFFRNSKRGSGSRSRGGSNRNSNRSNNNIYRNNAGSSGRTRARNGRWRKNPVVDGKQTFCNNCHSDRHYESFCPEPYNDLNENSDTGDGRDNFTMFCKIPAKQSLVGEALGSAVLDSGCPSNVAGEFWVQSYVETLCDADLEEIVVENSDASFQFGDGKCYPSNKKMSIPTYIGGEKIFLAIDVVSRDIPLLLSEKSMSACGMVIDFGQREVYIKGIKQSNVFLSSTGHYILPIRKSFTLAKANADMPLLSSVIKVDSDEVPTIDCFVWLVKDIFVDDMTRIEKMKIAKKLHRQFSHANNKRLKTLLHDAGINDDELFQIIDEVTQGCESCIKYKRGNPRPVVGLSMGFNFNQTIAMDLKEYTKGPQKVWFLHLIDISSRYSAACVLNSKRKEVVLSAIFKIWITTYGTPEKIMVDNGGEFNNDEFRDFCQNYNIRIRPTAAESPFSNSTVERHNALIGESVDKIMYETKC